MDGLLKYTKPGENMPASDDTQEMTETFSNYFIDKIDRIRKELDESDLSPKNDTCVTKKKLLMKLFLSHFYQPLRRK